MSSSALLQFLALLFLLAVTVPPLGRYIAKVYGSDPEGRAPGDRFFLPIERGAYRLLRVDPEHEQRWTAYALSLIAFSMVSTAVLYGIMRLQEHLPFNPTHVPGGRHSPVVRHRGELRHEHELAELRRREHDELPDLGRRPARGALRLRRRRPRRRDRADPRSHPLPDAAHRQLLGRHHPRHDAHPGTDLAAVRGRARQPGRHRQLPRVPCRHHRRGREAAHSRRSARGLDGDQATRQQRRRLLQRQLGPSRSRTRRSCRTSSSSISPCSSRSRSRSRSACW